MNLAAKPDWTEKALREAPANAIYVWCSEHMAYPRDLCARLQRADIKVVPASWLGERHWRGINPDRILLDHGLFDSEAGGVNAPLVEFLAWVANRRTC